MVNLSGHSKRQNQLGQGSGSRLQPIEALVSPACTCEIRSNSSSTVIYFSGLNPWFQSSAKSVESAVCLLSSVFGFNQPPQPRPIRSEPPTCHYERSKVNRL